MGINFSKRVQFQPNYSLNKNPDSSTTGTIYYVAEFDNEKGVGGTIVNKLKGEKTVSGTKVWSGLPNGFDRKNLIYIVREISKDAEKL